MGQPLEHGLRTARLARRLAQAMNLSEDEQVTVYYTGLLHFAGCTAESEIDARFFGDEMTSRPRMLTVAQGSRLELMATAMRTAHQGSPPLARAAMMARTTGSSTRCGTCTNDGTATACPVSCAARRSRRRAG